MKWGGKVKSVTALLLATAGTCIFPDGSLQSVGPDCGVIFAETTLGPGVGIHEILISKRETLAIVNIRGITSPDALKNKTLDYQRVLRDAETRCTSVTSRARR